MEHRIPTWEGELDHHSDKEEGILEFADELRKFVISEDEEAAVQISSKAVLCSCSLRAEELQQV